MPKIDGQDTLVFKGLRRPDQDKRKCIHLECAVTEAPFLKYLIAKAKEMDLFCAVWGHNVKLTNASGHDTKSQEMLP